MAPTRAELCRRIDQALGREPADLVIKGARILNVATGTLDEGDIAICGDWIVGTLRRLPRPRARSTPAAGSPPPASSTPTSTSRAAWSSPAEFERSVLVRGTTTAICDPHEIANVLGLAGIRYFLEASQTLRMTLKVQLSSCVPATELETSGARLPRPTWSRSATIRPCSGSPR